MNYVLAVKSPVYGKEGAFLAYQLAQALLEKEIGRASCRERV